MLDFLFPRLVVFILLVKDVVIEVQCTDMKTECRVESYLGDLVKVFRYQCDAKSIKQVTSGNMSKCRVDKANLLQ